MKKITEPSKIAFNQKYFIDMLCGYSNKNTCTAKLSYPTLAKIVDKLTANELEYLINKIENIL